MFDTLPRELQLVIYKKFDIDDRVKLGMIRKLAIPSLLQLYISNCLESALKHRPKNTSCCVSLHFSPGKYYTCFFDTTQHITYWYYTYNGYVRRNLINHQVKLTSSRQNIYTMPN